MGIDSQGLEVGENTQTHEISTSEHALFWPQDTEFDEQSNLTWRSAGAFGELGLRQLILVPGALRQRRLVGHQASYTHVVTSASDSVGARPKPGSEYCRSRRESLPNSGHRDQGTVVHCNRSVVKGGDGRGLKAFDDQINAQRKFPDCDRECDHSDRAMLPRETEDHGDVASDQKGRSDESE